MKIIGYCPFVLETQHPVLHCAADTDAAVREKIARLQGTPAASPETLGWVIWPLALGLPVIESAAPPSDKKLLCDPKILGDHILRRMKDELGHPIGDYDAPITLPPVSETFGTRPDDAVMVHDLNRASASIQRDRRGGGTIDPLPAARGMNRVHELMTRVQCMSWTVRVWSNTSGITVNARGPDERVTAALRDKYAYLEIVDALETFEHDVIAAYEILDSEGNGCVIYPSWP